MDNPYSDYFMKQAGSGLVSYSGHRYQSGNGIFGKILKNLKPALKYIASRGWEAFNTIGSEVLSGKTLSEAGTNQLLRTADTIAGDVKEKLSSIRKQKGLGNKRKLKSKPTIKKKTYKRRKTSKTLVRKKY